MAGTIKEYKKALELVSVPLHTVKQVLAEWEFGGSNGYIVDFNNLPYQAHIVVTPHKGYSLEVITNSEHGFTIPTEEYTPFPEYLNRFQEKLLNKPYVEKLINSRVYKTIIYSIVLLLVGISYGSNNFLVTVYASVIAIMNIIAGVIVAYNEHDDN